jgi:hypothetical protein
MNGWILCPQAHCCCYCRLIPSHLKMRSMIFPQHLCVAYEPCRPKMHLANVFGNKFVF